MNRFLISILIAVAAAACTDHDQFRISGTIEEELQQVVVAVGKCRRTGFGRNQAEQ